MCGLHHFERDARHQKQRHLLAVRAADALAAHVRRILQPLGAMLAAALDDDIVNHGRQCQRKVGCCGASGWRRVA